MANKPNVPDRVAFNMTPALKKEVERIMGVSDLASAPEVFRRAFTLLRIHVDAALLDQTVCVEGDGEKYRITLPFAVSA